MTPGRPAPRCATRRPSPIGVIDFAGDTAYWTGSVAAWASVTLEVTLEPAATPPSGSAPTGPVVLQADLGT
jgi:anti-sigma-K factor RskA